MEQESTKNPWNNKKNQKAFDDFVGDCIDHGMSNQQIELCVKAGYCPLPWQMSFHAATLLCDSGKVKEILCDGGRGGGKSRCQLAQAGIIDGQLFPGLKILFLRKRKTAAKESVNDLAKDTFSGMEYTISQKKVEFKNGTSIYFGGYNTSNELNNIIGIQYDEIIIEELTTIGQDEYDNIRASMRSSKKGWNTRVYSSTNPGGVGHKWVKERFVNPWKDKKEIFTRRIFSLPSDNPYIGDYENTLKSMKEGAKKQAWLFGDWDINEGAAFDFHYKLHVCDGTPYELNITTQDNVERHIVIDSKWDRMRGIDEGSAKPYCCLWVAYYRPMSRIYVYREDFTAGKTNAEQAARINQKTGVDERIIATYCDPAMFRQHAQTTFTSPADIYRVSGIDLIAGDRTRITGKRKIDDLLSIRSDGLPGLLIHKSCVNLITEMETIVYSDINPEDIDTQMDDHAIDALKYVLSRYRPTNEFYEENRKSSKSTQYAGMSALFR